MLKSILNFINIIFKDIINSNVELIDQLYEIIDEEEN